MKEEQIAAHPVVAAYIEEILKYIKAKDVHHDITEELLGHLLERVEELMEFEHLSKEEAIAVAVKGMGNAREVGIGLDAAHKPKQEWSVIAIFAAMFLLSIIALFVMPAGFVMNPAVKLVACIAGLLLMVAAYFGNYRKLARWSWALYGVTLTLMIYTLLYGVQMGGSQHWLSLGGFSFNMLEFSPYLLIIAIAGILYMDRMKRQASTSRLMLLINSGKKLIVFILLPMFIYVSAFCISELAIYSTGLFVLLLVYGHWRFMLASAGTLISGLVLLLSLNLTRFHYLYLLTRLKIMFSDDANATYQASRSLEAIGAGGMWGQGIGVANPRLPYAANELMYAYLVYSLGWIFGTVIALVVIAFVWRTIQMGMKTGDIYGRALITGIFSIFGLRLLWNLLMCLGIVPVLGITLPFLYLSSSSIFEFAMVGFALGIYRRQNMISRQQIYYSSLPKH